MKERQLLDMIREGARTAEMRARTNATTAQSINEVVKYETQTLVYECIAGVMLTTVQLLNDARPDETPGFDQSWAAPPHIPFPPPPPPPLPSLPTAPREEIAFREVRYQEVRDGDIEPEKAKRQERALKRIRHTLTLITRNPDVYGKAAAAAARSALMDTDRATQS